MRHLLLLTLTFSGLLFAQIPENHLTHGMLNCRFRNLSSQDLKRGLVLGFNELWSQASMPVALGPRDLW